MLTDREIVSCVLQHPTTSETKYFTYNLHNHCLNLNKFNISKVDTNYNIHVFILCLFETNYHLPTKSTVTQTEASIRLKWVTYIITITNNSCLSSYNTISVSIYTVLITLTNNIQHTRVRAHITLGKLRNQLAATANCIPSVCYDSDNTRSWDRFQGQLHQRPVTLYAIRFIN